MKFKGLRRAVPSMEARFPTAGELASGQIPSGLSRLKREPYWWDTAPRPIDARATLPKRVDVAIVGSGYTGLSAALTLLRRGRGVAVFDSEMPGYGASTRNGGQVGSGNQKFRVKNLVEIRGEKKATEMLREGVGMLNFIEELIQTENIACEFVRCGRFRGAVRSDHYENMARDMEDLRRVAGVEFYMVPDREQYKEIDTDEFQGGCVLPGDASINPGLFHAGLLEKVRTCGGIILGNTRVRSISMDASEFSVTTVAGTVRAHDVIIATNGYTDAAVPYLRKRIVPVGSAMVATDNVDQKILRRLMPSRRVYGNTRRVFSYFRIAPSEPRILWGGRVGRLKVSSDDRLFSHLARDMLAVFPGLETVPITHGWQGSIGYTYDGIPHIGRAPEGVFFALGYCGTGVSRSTYFGHKVALKVLGDPEGRTSFDNLLFPSHVGHPVAKQLVPLIELSYRFKDKMGI